MDYTLAPLPLEIADATRSPRRRRRHRKWKNGRFYIFLIFLWLRVVDVFILTCIYPKLPLVQKPVVIGWICVTATWSTVLLTAIWCRQKWATYVLAGSLIGAVIATLAGIPGLPDVPHPKRDFLFILEFTVAYFPVALVLIASQKINKLTTRSLETAGDRERDRPRGH